MATSSSILAWRILRTEEPGRLQSMSLKELDMTEHVCERVHTHTQDISRGAEWCTFFLTSNAPTYNLLTQILGLPEE